MKKAMLLLAVLGLAGSVWAVDPFVGTWKMNPSKSKFSDPTSAPKRITVKVEAQDNGMFKSTMDVAFDGEAINFHFSYKRDGKDYPTIGDPDSDAVAFTQIDANTNTYVVKKGGKQVKSGRIVVSKDGRTLTWVQKAKNLKGQGTDSTFVCEKQ